MSIVGGGDWHLADSRFGLGLPERSRQLACRRLKRQILQTTRNGWSDYSADDGDQNHHHQQLDERYASLPHLVKSKPGFRSVTNRTN